MFNVGCGVTQKYNSKPQTIACHAMLAKNK